MMVYGSYFDNSFKSHTRKARGGELFLLLTETTNIPKDFQSTFLRHNRNKDALNSFLTGKLLTVLLYSFHKNRVPGTPMLVAGYFLREYIHAFHILNDFSIRKI